MKNATRAIIVSSAFAVFPSSFFLLPSSFFIVFALAQRSTGAIDGQESTGLSGWWPGLESSEAPAEAPSSLLARPGLRRLSPGHPDESTGARLLAIYQDLVAGAKGVAA